MEWLEWLFDESSFIRRSQCGHWPFWLSLVYQIAQITIAICYYLIPLALGWLYIKRRQVLPKVWILLLFCLFIGLCGTTHAIEMVVFHRAIYRFGTLVAVLTALASVATALTLPGVVWHISKLPSIKEYERAAQEANRQVMAADILRRMERARAEAALQELTVIRERLILLQNSVGQNQDVKEAVKEIRARLHQIRNTVGSVMPVPPPPLTEVAQNASNPPDTPG